MEEESLMGFGMTRNEVKIYLVLVRFGSLTGTQIAEKSKIHRTNVYDSLERLIEKGLVSYILKDKAKFFEATDPSNLMNLIKQKEDDLKKILPELILNKKLAKQTEVSVSEGVVAARNALMNLLKHKQPILIYGVPKEAVAILGEFYLEKYHRERIRLKIPERVIYNEDASSRISQLKKLPLCEVRALPKEFNSPMSINICGDEVFFELFTREPCLTIFIKSPDIAEIYRKYFDIMWKIAKDA